MSSTFWGHNHSYPRGVFGPLELHKGHLDSPAIATADLQLPTGPAAKASASYYPALSHFIFKLLGIVWKVVRAGKVGKGNPSGMPVTVQNGVFVNLALNFPNY